MSESEETTFTILFTDIQGYSRQSEALPARMRKALRRHDQILRRAIEDHDGWVIKSQLGGDAFMAAFLDPSSALMAACDAQLTLSTELWPRGINVLVRMGLHAGSAEVRDDDLFGDTVNRCARIRDVAHGGQVLVSGALVEVFGGRLPGEVSLESLGHHRLKDLRRPEEIFQVQHAGLPAKFPALETVDSHPNNLPIMLTSFVGREHELAEVRDLIDQHRLVTLTGPGGCGKTRMGCQVAAELLPSLSGGAWLVPLSEVTDPTGVPLAVADALALREERGHDLNETIQRYLMRGERLLLLDNCEHLLDGCADLVAQLLKVCAGLRILATSREDLQLGGELVYHLPPLSLPETGQSDPITLRRSDSVALLERRAHLIHRRFTLTTQNGPAVAELVHRLDGNPLAIELVAARLSTMSPGQILDHLGRDLDLVSSSHRRGPMRHQSLLRAISWSYDLLEAPESAVFRRLSVFVGGFDLDAAEAVAGMAHSAVSMIDALAALYHKSLLVVDTESNDGPRFTLLETIRAFAGPKLAEEGEALQARHTHARYYLRLALTGEPHLKGPDQVAWLSRLERERENCNIGLACLIEEGDLPSAYRLASSLWRFWYLRGEFSAGMEQIERALHAGSPDDQSVERANALHAAGTLASLKGDQDLARRYLEEALTMRRGLGDDAGTAGTLANLAMMAYESGNLALARDYLEESLPLGEQLKDRWFLSVALGNLATIALAQNEYARSMKLGEAVLKMQREIGDEHAIANSLITLGATNLALGHVVASQAHFAEALHYLEKLDDRSGVQQATRWLGATAHREGNLDTAQALAEASLAIAEALDMTADIADARRLLGDIALDRRDYDTAEALYAAGMDAATVIGSKEAIAEITAGIGRLARARGQLDQAERCANRSLQIWNELGLSRRSAEALEDLACVAADAGRPQRALRLAAAAAATRAALATPPSPARAAALDVARAKASMLVSSSEADTLWSEGWAMSRDQAVQLASEQVTVPPVVLH